MDENKVKVEAKKIMDNFMKALNKIDVDDEFILDRKNSFRDEGKTENNLDLEFKQSFLSNASKTKGDAILANKGSWVE